MATFDEAKARIKREYNIVDYIQSNNVQLTPSGVGVYKGLCPFHNEKTPSFTVSEDFQNYKCFGCGASGDIITFAQHVHTTDFVDTVKFLANDKGIVIDDYKGNEKPKYDILSIQKVVADAQEFYHNEFLKLDDTHPAKVEITKRGLDMNSKLYGYAPEAPNNLYKHLKTLGHPDESIELSNLVIFFEDNREPFDFFHGRLLVTLSDFMGRPVSFTARKLFEGDRMPGKYVNGKDSPIFHKKSTLFGVDTAKSSARELKEIIVVEGQFDVLALHSIGVENVVATSGTAFTSEHTSALRRLVGVDGKITFVFDGDEAGIKAAIKVFSNHPDLHTQSYVVTLAGGADPCDYVKAGKHDEIKTLIEKSQPMSDFIVDKAHENYKKGATRELRMKFVIAATQLTKKAQDIVIIDQMLTRISILSAFPIESVRDIYSKTKTTRNRNIEQKTTQTQQLSPKIQLSSHSEADNLMYSALALLVRGPELILPELPRRRIPTKFQPFMKELMGRYKQTVDNNSPWLFISDEYDDSDFAILLQNKKFLGDPKENEKSFIQQFLFLYNKALDMYEHEVEQTRRSNALSAIVDKTDAKEIAQAISVYEDIK